MMLMMAACPCIRKRGEGREQKGLVAMDNRLVVTCNKGPIDQTVRQGSEALLPTSLATFVYPLMSETGESVLGAGRIVRYWVGSLFCSN